MTKSKHTEHRSRFYTVSLICQPERNVKPGLRSPRSSPPAFAIAALKVRAVRHGRHPEHGREGVGAAQGGAVPAVPRRQRGPRGHVVLQGDGAPRGRMAARRPGRRRRARRRRAGRRPRHPRPGRRLPRRRPRGARGLRHVHEAGGPEHAGADAPPDAVRQAPRGHRRRRRRRVRAPPRRVAGHRMHQRHPTGRDRGHGRPLRGPDARRGLRDDARGRAALGRGCGQAGRTPRDVARRLWRQRDGRRGEPRVRRPQGRRVLHRVHALAALAAREPGLGPPPPGGVGRGARQAGGRRARRGTHRRTAPLRPQAAAGDTRRHRRGDTPSRRVAM